MDEVTRILIAAVIMNVISMVLNARSFYKRRYD